MSEGGREGGREGGYFTVTQGVCYCRQGSGLDVRDRDMSAARRCYDEPKRGLQVFDDVPDEQLEVDPVGRPVEHVAARQMVSGEAVYTTDIVSRDGQTLEQLL